MAANLPTHFDRVTVVHDRAYGPEPSQTLDLYVPADPKDKQMEVIVFFLWRTLDLWDKRQLSIRWLDIRGEGVSRGHSRLQKISLGAISGVCARLRQSSRLGR